MSPNKTHYIFFEISSFSQERSKKCSKIRLDYAGNDFVFFHCHFHVLFSKQHWVVNTFFFCGQNQLQVWRKCFSKEKTHSDEKKSFFILQKSFSDQKTSSPTKHRSWWCKNFCEHIKTCPSKTLFYLWDKMTKAFFQLIEKFSFFFNGWWNVHPWNRFHGWTLHWMFTEEESVAWTYTTKESFPLYSELYDSTIYGIDFRTLFISE